MSSIQAVRMESQATFLNDQDTLHVLLTESGVGIEEIACTHASADNNDVVCLCGCLLQSDLEPLCLKHLLQVTHCLWPKFEDPMLSINLDKR